MHTLSLPIGTPAGDQSFGLDQFPLVALAQVLLHEGRTALLMVKDCTAPVAAWY